MLLINLSFDENKLNNFTVYYTFTNNNDSGSFATL